METEVVALVFQITDIATMTMHAVTSTVLMSAEECFKQALAINSDATSPYLMVCLPEVVEAAAETAL